MVQPKRRPVRQGARRLPNAGALFRAGALAMAALITSPAQAGRDVHIIDTFDQGVQIGTHWAKPQLQDGTIAPGIVGTNPGRAVAVMKAGPKANGRVGKADLIHRFEPAGAGAMVEIAASILIPAGYPRNSVTLIDLECAKCGPEGNPGNRLYLRDGRLRVDRKKVGFKHAFTSEIDHMVREETWHRIVWRTWLGKDDAGRLQVTLDDQLVLDATGTNLPTAEHTPGANGRAVLEAVDRIQLGITANSNDQAAMLLVDDVEMRIIEP